MIGSDCFFFSILFIWIVHVTYLYDVDSFLAYQCYRKLVDQMFVFLQFLDSSLLLILHVWFLFFLYFSYFRVQWSVCERHDLLGTFYVLINVQRQSFFFSCGSNIIILICRFLSMFCLAVPNGSHILSWMCLKGLILIFFFFFLQTRSVLTDRSTCKWLFSRFESENTTWTKRDTRVVGI